MKHITITPSGFLASLPTSGPGVVNAAKIRALVFGTDANKLGWEIRLSGQKW